MACDIQIRMIPWAFFPLKLQFHISSLSKKIYCMFMQGRGVKQDLLPSKPLMESKSKWKKYFQIKQTF